MAQCKLKAESPWLVSWETQQGHAIAGNVASVNCLPSENVSDSLGKVSGFACSGLPVGDLPQRAWGWATLMNVVSTIFILCHSLEDRSRKEGCLFSSLVTFLC